MEATSNLEAIDFGLEALETGFGRAVRRRKHRSQAYIAEKLTVALGRRVAVSTVNRWENGHNRPTGETAAAYGRLIAELNAGLGVHEAMASAPDHALDETA